MLKRREFLMAPIVAAALQASPTGAVPATRRYDASRLRSLETGQARLGVCFLDTASGEVSGHRMEEHFAMCSTFKLALVAACLRDADAGRLDLAHVQRESRERLLQWMQDTDTGPNRLRAGLPSEWRTGNKTGTGRTVGTTNKCNDVAITFPPGRPPIVITAYFDSGEFTPQVERRHEAVLAEVGRIAAQWAVS